MTCVVVNVCDVCGRRAGVLQRFVAGERAWDVGDCCMDTPFKTPEPRLVDVVVTVSGRTAPPEDGMRWFGERRCTHCGGAGHNRRTCRVKP